MQYNRGILRNHLVLAALLALATLFTAGDARTAQQPPPAKKHFLLVLHNQVKAGKVKISDEEFQKLGNEHFAALKKAFAEGKIIVAGPRLDEVEGICVLEVNSEEDAQAIARNDAFVKAGIFTFELHEMRIALLRGVTPVN